MSAKEEQPSGLVNVAELADLVAHEVNNLLNSIVLHAALLERSLPQESQAGVQAELGIIRQAIQRAGAMLRRWQQATPRPLAPLEAFDLNGLIRDLSLPQRLQGTAGGEVGLRLQPAPQLPAVLGNREDSGRLIRLLLKSAVEASPDGGTVTLRTEMTHGHVVLSVEDQGATVEPELLERIFEPFTSVRGGLFAKSDEEELWLATCKVLARRQKCTIAATPGSAGGVMISVRFPAALGEKA
jgi:signal transduction histidine kinase